MRCNEKIIKNWPTDLTLAKVSYVDYNSPKQLTFISNIKIGFHRIPKGILLIGKKR